MFFSCNVSAVNNLIATTLICFFLTFNFLIVWEIKSFIFNVFKLFNAYAGSSILAVSGDEDKENDSYWVEFPDLEGCNTYRSTVEETMEMAQEALGLYLVSLMEHGQTHKAPSDICGLKIDDGFTSYVIVDVNKYRRETKAIKKTLTIPQWMNDEGVKRNVNFSALLQDALIERFELK